MTTSYEVVVSFDLDVGTFLEPDGKYQVELCESGVRMRNHLFNGFFRYDNIVRAYLLPHHVGETKDECESKVFVIHLQEPVLKGKRSYKCLVLQLTKEPHDVDVDMTKWAKYVELRPSMKQRLYFLFPRIFSIISGQSVFPEYDFKNRSHKSSVECSLGGNRGYLYPLHSSIMFLHNPTVIVGYDKIKSLAFLKHARQRGLYPTFSLQFLIDEHCASVFGCSSTTLTISGVSSDDYLYLQPFLSKIFGKKKYKIPIKNHYDEEVVDECKGHNTAGIGDDDALGSEYGSDDDEDAEQGTESDNIEQPVPSGAGTSTKRNKSKGASSNDVIDDKPSKKKTKPTEDDAEPPAAKKHIKKRIGSFFRFTKENYSRVAEMNPDARTPAERNRILVKEYEGLSDAEKQKYVAMDKAAAEVGEHKKERYSKKPIGSKKFRHCYRVTNTITKKSTPCYDLCMASEHVRTCPGRIINAREKAEEAGMSTFIIDHYSFTLIDGPDYPQMCGGPGGAHRYEAMHLTTGEMACVFGIHELIKYTGCGLSESTVNNYRLAAMSVGEDFFVCAGYHVKFYHDDEEAEMLTEIMDIKHCYDVKKKSKETKRCVGLDESKAFASVKAMQVVRARIGADAKGDCCFDLQKHRFEIVNVQGDTEQGTGTGAPNENQAEKEQYCKELLEHLRHRLLETVLQRDHGEQDDSDLSLLYEFLFVEEAVYVMHYMRYFVDVALLGDLGKPANDVELQSFLECVLEEIRLAYVGSQT